SGPESPRLSDNVSIQASGRGNPWINLSDGRELLTGYSGITETSRLVENNQAAPLALAAADLDEDGVPDLICSYSKPGGGVITVSRGNVDSLYPNSAEARKRKAEGAFTDSPFLSPATVFDLPIEPELVEAGDFNADGHSDIAIAKLGGEAIYLLPGDGHGGLGAPQQIALPGKISAMAGGEINRADGLRDLVVGIVGPGGPELMVFEGPAGALESKPEVFDLPDQARAVALGY